MDDLELARAIAGRDEAAMDALVERYHTPIMRFLRHLTRHHENAEDLAQQTLIRAVEGAGRFDGRSTLRAWLLGIAFREFTRFRRRRLWLPLTADQASRERQYERVEQAEVLLAAIGELPDAQRAVFLMHHVEELSLEEIAAALQIPHGTVKSRLHHARKRLALLLGEEVSYATNSSQC